MMYTQNSDLVLVEQVAQLWSKGLSWADIAAKVNKPIHEIEQLPTRFAEPWIQAIQRLIVVTQHELTLKTLTHLQALLATTTDPKILVTLMATITRFLKPTAGRPKGQEPAPTPSPLPVVAPPVPTPARVPVVEKVVEPVAEPVDKLAEIRANLSTIDQTIYLRLRQQFRVFSDFVRELKKQEPALYQKLLAKNLLPEEVLRGEVRSS